MIRRLAACSLVPLLLLPLAAQAKTFRYASVGDVRTMDPHGLYETFTQATLAEVYESLVRLGPKLDFEPSLATSWSQPAPDVWRFTLRPNVRFHGGEPFDADDVVFSFKRAMSDGSDLKVPVASVLDVVKVDPLTVDVKLKGPNPIFVREIAFLGMMSKRWAEAHDATQPVDIRQGKENYASRNANGTGPFKLVERTPDIRTRLTVNPDWWDKPQHNLDEVVFTPISNNATRTAALIAGDVDMMEPVPVQDIERLSAVKGMKVLQGPEFRTVFLGMDQARDELTDSTLKGRNPFKDVRVRRALYEAIDIQAIRAKVMRNQARPAALMVAPGVNGWDKALDVRLPYDPAASRKLLAEAGYPKGFDVGLDCPNDRLVNDAAICEALTAMFSRVGVAVKANIQTRAIWSQKVLSRNTSFYLQSWTTPSYDALNPITSLMATPRGNMGSFNSGGYSSAAIDALIPSISAENDPAHRLKLIAQVFRIHAEDVGHLPLHQQFLAWGVRDGVELPLMPDNVIKLHLVRMK